ncbi:MAG: hypothetical protein QOE92_920 [Chloroflexota bacterium]|nr:hypothetical protein [Chloroflexota bacterium]
MSLPAVLLQDSFRLDLPDITVPVVGSRWAVGILFLVHIVIASYTMGAVVLGPTYEAIGLARRDPRYERLARGLGNVNLKIFSLGATFGAFAVVVLTGLYPTLTVTLGTTFFWPLLVGFSVWFVVIFAMLTYNLRWDRFRSRALHVADGYLVAAGEHVFLVVIVAVDSYMLTPGSGAGAAAFFNPTYWPELGHRFVGNISWASFFIAAVAVVYSARSRTPEDRAFHQWVARRSMVVGFLTLLVQAGLGALYVEGLKAGSPGAFEYSFQGPVAWLWIVQAVFLGILVAGSNLYFTLSRVPRPGLSTALSVVVVALVVAGALPAGVIPRQLFWLRYAFLALALALSLAHFLAWRRGGSAAPADLPRSGRLVLAATGVTAMMLFLLMGVIRTTARTDFTIYGRLRENQSTQVYQPPSERFYP